MSKKVIGIDLGTGNSCVSIIESGKPVVVVNSEGCRTTPSVVSFKDGDYKVGQSANRQRIVYPEQTIYNIKRFMGNEYEQCSEIISKVPYKVNNVAGKPRVEVNGREYSPEEISSYILAKMKKTAEDYLGEEVTDAVITCPAWFDNSAREATKMAGELAGLHVMRVINEPTAAILASNISTSEGEKKVLVCDVGCGTTDFSVAEISEGIVEIKASRGDVFLGGSDWDNAIAQWLISNFRNDYNIDLSTDKQAYSRIIEAAEKAKIELSNSSSTEINLPYIAIDDNRPLHLTTTLTRAKMEQLTSVLVNKVIGCAKDAINAAKINVNELDCILLVGGQTRSLAIQNALSEKFGIELNKSVNPDEAVSQGAAIQANIIMGGEGSTDVLLLDVTPLTLGIETLGGVMTALVEANTTIPCSRTEIFTTAQDNQSAVTLSVLQGERPMAADNKQIGIFNLDGITPARRGIPQIEVKFDIDANGILTVSAKDKTTGKEQHITIEGKDSLSKEEIEKIKAEAKEHAEEDKKTKEKLDKINKCDSIIYQTESALENFKDNPSLTEEDKSFFNEKMEILKKMKRDEDFSQLDNINDEVNKRWQAVSMKAYASQKNNDGANAGPFNFNGANPFDFGNNTANGQSANNATEDAEVQDAK